MKRVTASEARRNWFRLLDEAAAGEVIVIERGGRRILLRRDAREGVGDETPGYADIIRAPDAGHADRWTWEWNEREGDLRPTDSDDA